MNLVLVNRIRSIYYHGLNKGFGLKFSVGSWVWQEASENSQRIHQPKHCEYNNKDEDNNPNTLNDKNIYKFIKYGIQVKLI